MATKKASKTITETGVTIEFADGNTLATDVSELSDEIKHQLMLHGLSQKLGDSYAGAELGEAHELAASVYENLKSGQFKAQREGSGGTQRSSMLVEALSAATGKSADECREVVNAMTDEQKKGLRKHPDVAKELARISAERAAEKARKAEAEAQGAEGPSLSELMG